MEAYGFTMSSQYNACFRPAEILIYEGKTHLIRQRKTIEDILKNQVPLDFSNLENRYLCDLKT